MAETTTQITPEIQQSINRFMPFLEEIRKKILILVTVFLFVAIVTGVFYRSILRHILSYFDLTGVNMVITSPSQIFELGVETGIFFGVLAIFPLFVFFTLRFLKPALSPKEFKLILSLLPVSLLLMFMGFSFGVWAMQYIITFFAQSADALSTSNIWALNVFFHQIIISGLLMGILFQFPIVLTILIRLKVVKRQSLVKQRPIIYTVILLAAAIGPSTDVFSLILFTIPLLLMFEITLLLNK